MACIWLAISLTVGVALWLLMMHVLWDRMLYPRKHRFLPLNMWAVLAMALVCAACGFALAAAFWHAKSLLGTTRMGRVTGRIDMFDCGWIAYGAMICATLGTIWLKRRRVLCDGLETQPRCAHCGYILHGLKRTVWSVRCPECGKANHTSDIVRRYRRELFAKRVLWSATRFYTRYDTIRRDVRQAPLPFDDENASTDTRE